MNKASLLSGSSLFCELKPNELEQLAQHTQLRPVRARQQVVMQGQRGSEMFAVVHGRFKVVRNHSDGREVVLAILEGGDVFGELAMIDGGVRTATVEALEDGELMVLHRDSVFAYLESHPKVMRNLIITLCERLRSMDEMVQDTLFLPLPQRLAKVLRQLASDHGEDTPEGIRIDLKLTQQELANFIGATRESINKQLGQWENQGWVRRDHGKILLLDQDALP